ncbi:MAG: hypothetical protein Q9196_005967 [Gyalolechia fulgens]
MERRIKAVIAAEGGIQNTRASKPKSYNQENELQPRWKEWGTSLTKRNISPPGIRLQHRTHNVGDFNTHHLTWGDSAVKSDSRVEDLRGIIDEFLLTKYLRKGTATWRQPGRNAKPQVLDLCLTTDGLADLVTYCRIAKIRLSPTETELDITIGDAEPEVLYRWGKANLPRYGEELRKRLTNWPATILDIPERMNQATLALITAIQEATKIAVRTIRTTFAIARRVQRVHQRLRRVRRQKQKARTTLEVQLMLALSLKRGVQGVAE